MADGGTVPASAPASAQRAPARPPMPAGGDYRLLSPRSQVLAGVVLAFSNFMVVLDLTICNVSVPHIAGNLGVSLDQGTWVITSYAVAEAICVPLTGWLSQRFGTVRLFLAAMLGFGLFSFLCGISVTLPMLVICRIGQGLCGGPIMPMSQTLMVRVFPPEKRAVAMAGWAATVMLGPALGPIIGGWIADTVSWHWIFFINVPIAGICTFAGLALLMKLETPTVKLPIDKVGLALLVFWIGCLQVLLDTGRDRDWFADPWILTLGIAAAVGFCAFIIWELTEDHPVVDLKIFRYRGFSATVAVQTLCFGAFFAGIVVVPQWLQTAMGYTATKAGMITAMHAYAGMITAQVVARIMGKFDIRILISFGCFWMGAIALVRTFWSSQTDFFNLAWPMFAQGVGMACMFIPISTAALSAVPIEQTANAAGLQNFCRTMATAIATSLVLTSWNDSQTSARSMLAERLHPDAMTAALQQQGMGTEQVTAMLSQLVDQQATAIGVDHTFMVAGFILIACAFGVWLSPKVPLTRLGQGGPPGGH